MAVSLDQVLEYGVLPAVAVLLCLAQRASAIAVARTVPQDSLAIALARSARLAVVDQVGSLFAWARVGDRVLIDVDEGAVKIHPSEATVARFRSGR